MSDATPEPIVKVAMGFMAAKHLFVASEIGVFVALAQGAASIEDLVVRTGIPRRTLQIAIDAMVSLGFVEQQEELLRNSSSAAAFLAGAPGVDLRPMLRFWNRISYPAWMGLEDAMRTGEGQSHFERFSEADQQIFSTGVESFTAPVAAALASAYDFSRHRLALDLGGGTGSFLLALLRRYSALNATLFELPGACAVARQRLAREPEGDRIQIIAGNFLTDPLPVGHDVVLIVNTVHVLSAVHNVDLLRRARERVSVGARLLLVDFWTDASRTQPPAATLISGEFLAFLGKPVAGEMSHHQLLANTALELRDASLHG